MTGDHALRVRSGRRLRGHCDLPDRLGGGLPDPAQPVGAGPGCVEIRQELTLEAFLPGDADTAAYFTSASG